MPITSSHHKDTTNKLALRLLKTEHLALVDWLHDDLAQNLVAIKSFATAIMEQNKDSIDDTVELANIINQAATAAYQSTYNLMQELRAEDAADQTIRVALDQCLQNARLKEKNIRHQFRVDTEINDLDYFTKSVILRSVRTFINFSTLFQQTSKISIDLHIQPDTAEKHIELQLVHEGKYDISHNDVPSLSSLRERIESIGGSVHIKTNNLDNLKLILCLHPHNWT